ncbi:LOW QUALITY PROTEIN: quinone oxidoreductase-like protein 2 [Spheniscus humboldti]
MMFRSHSPSTSLPVSASPSQRTLHHGGGVPVGIHYCGLNFIGILACQGLCQGNHAHPFTPGETVTNLCRKLAWEGRIVGMGFTRGKIPLIPTNLLFLKVSATGVCWSQYQEDDFHIFPLLSPSIPQYCQGNIHPHVGAVFKLEEVNKAFNHMLQCKGKVIISMK